MPHTQFTLYLILEHGYYLDLPGIGCLNFGTADQAPAEAYMSQNYTAYVAFYSPKNSLTVQWIAHSTRIYCMPHMH